MRNLHILLIIALVAIIGCGSTTNEYRGDPIASNTSDASFSDIDAADFLSEFIGDVNLEKLAVKHQRTAQVGGEWTQFGEAEFVTQVSYAFAGMIGVPEPFRCQVAAIFEAQLHATYTSTELIGFSVFVDFLPDFPAPLPDGIPC